MLHQVAEGNEAAFVTLFHAWRDKIYFFLLRITHSPESAEDALQDIFVKIWTNRESLKAVDNFSAYLYRVSQNHAINGIRRMALHTIVLADFQRTTGAAALPADEILLHKQLQEKLQLAIDNLPPQQKKVYTLSRVNGLKHEEIARELNISLSTVKNHMTQALQAIREYLGGQFPISALYCIGILKIFQP